MISEYIIDFERLNQLTVHENDNPNATNAYGPNYCYSITRGIIKEYMKIYMDHLYLRHDPKDEKFKEVVEVLHWNKILISAADIRDQKINKLI